MTLAASVVTELRLAAFKSFRAQRLPLSDLSLLVGRNGSGKSNALDGLSVLASLAQGEPVRDALDGGREGPAIRGGAIGCAPFGESSFALGCSVRTGENTVDLDLEVQTEPEVQILRERLALNGEDLLVTEPPNADSSDVVATWSHAGAEPHRRETFRASRLLATQVLARIPATRAGQRIHLAAAQVLAALRGVFVLDPVPHTMRGYVPRRDILLRRHAENLSATIASLLERPETRERLMLAVDKLNEHEVVDVRTSASALDDVTLTLFERFGEQTYPVPARMMSDGTLRFLAILATLMQAPTIDTMPEPLAAEDALGQTHVVIEELENGLHASQASMLVGLMRDEVERRRVRVLATAHSPALLDALSGAEHRNVVVCQRHPDGRSTLTRLVDLPAYVDVVARGGLGRAVVQDRLRDRQAPANPAAALEDLFGERAS